MQSLSALADAPAISRRPRRRFPWQAALLLAPFGLAYALFFLWPAIQTVQLSLTQSTTTTTLGYVGLDNYLALFADPEFWTALLQTLYFCLLTVLPLTAIGLLAALLAERMGRASRLVQAAFFLPYVLPVGVMTLIAGWMLHPNFGVINYLFNTQIAWLSDPFWAMPMVGMATLWWTVGFNMLFFMAGLRNIPADVYEAAALEGARGFAMFRFITWPQLMPVTVMVLLLQLIGSLKIFSQPYILTGGGPFNSTRVVLHYMYETGFVNDNAGYASAVAMVFMAVVLLVSLAQGFLLSDRHAR
ncbi:carbohydrate ABC transporter permease [Rhodoferax sp.]|uniref:carbohydrate ABC transporter permease n=1 Tax=Rhodoferax sp. TaxID=50421 RepID=UPI00374DEB3E